MRVTRRDPVDVAAVMAAAAALVGQASLAHGFRHKRLEIDVPDQSLMMLGDDDLLHRAVFELLALNAVQ